jgi:hypothetical protein
MVRTGARAAVLADLLAGGGFRRQPPPPAPRLSDLSSGLSREVLDIYVRLGGTNADPVLRPGGWDLAFEDGLLVELDEELHFNRYRLFTLSTPALRRSGWAPVYRELCSRHKADCLAAGRWGQRWSTPSSAAMFGAPGAPGSLDGPGAPRWKQRALYDAIKDLLPGVRLARVSVHDTLGERTLGAALSDPSDSDAAALVDLVVRRSS